MGADSKFGDEGFLMRGPVASSLRDCDRMKKPSV